MAIRPYDKGRSYEYRLMLKLRRLGYFVIRAPASGGGYRKVSLPDLLAIKGGKVLGIEVKMRSDDRDIYIEKTKVERLLRIEQKYGIKMYLCVWYKLIKEFRCIELSQYSSTSNTYAIYRREDIISTGKKVEEL